MANTQNIRNELKPIAADIQHSWSVIMYDVGPCTRKEKVELALDRLDDDAAAIVDAIIAKYGYEAVENVVSTYII